MDIVEKELAKPKRYRQKLNLLLARIRNKVKTNKF